MKVVYEGKRSMVQVGEDYSNLFSPTGFNWVEFTLINVRFEVNKMFGQLELDLALLGLHINFSYVYDVKVYKKEVKRLLKLADSPKEGWVELK